VILALPEDLSSKINKKQNMLLPDGTEHHRSY